jgi:glycosyltransferase involved in cell wall biosynthesis
MALLIAIPFYSLWAGFIRFSGLQQVAADIVKLKDLHPGVKLLVVGRGSGLASLEELVNQHNAENRIILTSYPPYEEIPQAIRR